MITAKRPASTVRSLLRLRLPDRWITDARTKHRTASQISSELPAIPRPVMDSDTILNTGLSFRFTTEPPFSAKGTTA